MIKRLLGCVVFMVAVLAAVGFVQTLPMDNEAQASQSKNQMHTNVVQQNMRNKSALQYQQQKKETTL